MRKECKMKKIISVLIALALCMALSACGKKDSADPSNAAQDAGAAAPSSVVIARRAYADALTQLMDKHIFPDGKKAAHDVSYDMAQNKFAVYDIDGDGREELIILYTTTHTDGTRGWVCEYDEKTKTLRIELTDHANLEFYNNGAVKAEATAYYGLAWKSFTPYNLYQYSPATDDYQLSAYVDAWDRSLTEIGWENKSFPTEVDVSGTGIVYYVMAGGVHDVSSPMDAGQYNAWYAANVGDYIKLELQYFDMTAQNIALFRA